MTRRQFMKISAGTVNRSELAGRVYPWAMLVPIDMWTAGQIVAAGSYTAAISVANAQNRASVSYRYAG